MCNTNSEDTLYNMSSMIKQLQYANHRVGALTKESSLERYVNTVLCIKNRYMLNIQESRTSYTKHICKGFYMRFKTFKQAEWISYPQSALERLRTHRNSLI